MWERLCTTRQISTRCWYPLLRESPPPDVLCLPLEQVREELVKRVLSEHAVIMVYEFANARYWKEPDSLLMMLEEWSISGTARHPCELFWTSDALDWVIYYSHEGTVAFGGKWLVDALAMV